MRIPEPGADFIAPRSPRFIALAGRRCFSSDAEYLTMLRDLSALESAAARELIKLFNAHVARKTAPRQMGIAAGWLYLIGLVALVGALGWIYHAIDSRAFARGEASKQAEWNKANEKAQKKADKLRGDQQDLLREEEKKRQAAEATAQDYETKWKEARRAGQRQGRPLAVADCGNQQPEASQSNSARSADLGADRAPRLRLTWEFVSLHDSAWTGAGGQPLFGDPAGIIAQAGGPDPAAPSPHTLDELVDVHKDNAARCSADRRQLGKLIDVIEKLRAQWDRVMR